MNPVEPRTENLAPGWERVVYAEDQPQYLPLPSLQNRSRHECPVVSVWEFNDGEVALLKAMLENHANGGQRPRISLTLWTFGDALQPIQLQVGESGGPYMVPCPPDPPRNSYHPVA